MNVVKCKNGHFFDGDTYEVCPTCGAPVAGPEEENKKSKEKTSSRLSRLFKRKEEPKTEKKVTSKKKKEEDPPVVPAEPENKEVPDVPVKPDKPQEKPATIAKDDSEADDLTVMDTSGSLSYWDDSKTVYDTVKAEEAEEAESDDDKTVYESIKEKPEIKNEGIVSKDIVIKDREEDQGNDKEKGTMTLEEEIRKLSANSDGKTMSFFDMRVSAAEKEDIPSEVHKPEDSKPAVKQRPKELITGWLVCIKGPQFAETFPIRSGNNSIGRSPENDIVIDRDGGVSRVKHALLTYEPKKRVFYLRPGDQSGLTYLNDEFLMEITELHSRDVIGMGDSSFLFIPLCDENFSWDTYIN